MTKLLMGFIWKPTILIAFSTLVFVFPKLTDKAEKVSPESVLMEVSDFELTDHKGISHKLSYYDDHKAVVLFVQGNGCPIVRNAFSEYAAIQAEFEEQGVQFFMINSNLQDNREQVRAEAEEFAAPSPILVDDQCSLRLRALAVKNIPCSELKNTSHL